MAALLALCTTACGALTPEAQVSATGLYESYIADASRRFAIPASWIEAVMHVESAGNPAALSPKGAMGLMQVMPKTWSDLRAQYQLGNDPFDPRDNILAGAAYLRQMLDRFGTSGFLAAYHAGPKAFEGYLAGHRPLAGETKRYLSVLARLLPDLPFRDLPDSGRMAPNWRSAALFAGILTTSPLLNPKTSDERKSVTSPARHFGLAPQSNGLFVSTPPTDQR